MRKFLLLATGVLLAAGTLSACFGGPPPPPPPPPTDPRDVLVVGDSVSFSLGCVLGGGPGCPSRPGYTTINEYSGACTITPGTVLLYNGGFVGAPNCDTVPDEHGRTWDQASSFFVPKVVVINTAGWEVVDRWIESGTPSQPDAQWGGPTGAGTRYERAAVYYSSRLFNAINMFRSRGAKVLISVAPYFDPPEPVPPPSQVPAGLGCSWWEPYDTPPPLPSAPAGSECPGQWTSPGFGVGYRPSKVKTDQFNGIISLVKNQYFGGDPNVVLFRFDTHFNGPPPGAYTSYLCAPPDDDNIAAENVLDFHPGVQENAPGTTAWQCNNGSLNSPANPWPYALLARAPDNGHLWPAGGHDILQYYLEPCVKALIPVAGGDISRCS